MSYKNRLNEYNRLKTEGREIPGVLKKEFDKSEPEPVTKKEKPTKK